MTHLLSTRGNSDYLDDEQGLSDGDCPTSLSDLAPVQLVLRTIETKSPLSICVSWKEAVSQLCTLVCLPFCDRHRM